MMIGSILEAVDVAEAVSGSDVVFNFAGISNLDDALTKPAETVSQNILGTVNILEACRSASVDRYMHASSVYVYSNRGGFYRCSKQAAELYVEEYQRCSGLDFTILRFGTLYGQRANSKNSIYRYLFQALTERKIQCSGSGEELREYISVRDAARLCVHALDDEFQNEHVTVTGPYPLQFRRLMEMIRDILGGDIEFFFDGGDNQGHYRITPYTFEPKIGHKLTTNKFVDMGQGLLECLREIHEGLEKTREESVKRVD